MVSNGAETGDNGNDVSTRSSTFQLVLGALLLALAAKQRRGRPKDGETPERPRWMSTVEEFTAPKAAGMGVLLSAVNPKNLSLTMAAAAAIGQAGLSGGDDVIAMGCSW